MTTDVASPDVLSPSTTADAPRAASGAEVSDAEGAPARRSAFERWAPLVAGLAIAVPTVVSHYLPMSDLPMHEAVVGILRHFGDDSYFPRDLYVMNFGHPNQLFYLLAWPLSYVTGTAVAVKLVIATAQVLIFVSGARFAEHMGRPRSSALLLAPLALGFTFYWGLVANLLGFAAFFFALPILDRAAAQPTLRRAAATFGVLVLAFLAHESVMATSICAIVFLAFCHPLELRATTVRLLPALVATGCAIGHFIWARGLFPVKKLSIPAIFLPLRMKLFLLPNDLFGSHDFGAQTLALGLGLLAVAVLVGARIRAARASRRATPRGAAASGPIARVQAFAYAFRFELIGAAFLFAFLVLPFNYNGTTLIHERFLGPAWGILALCAGPKGRPPRLSKIASSVIPIAVLLLAWPQFVDADRTYRDLDALIEMIPKGSAVCSVSVDPSRTVAATRVYSAGIGPGRVVAERGGRANHNILISPISPILIRPIYRWDDYDFRNTMLSSAWAFQPSHDFKRFGWVIGESRDPYTRSLLAEVLSPEATVVASRGEWLLFRSKFVVPPIDEPELPPDPSAETVIMRLDRANNEHRRKARGEPGPAPVLPALPAPSSLSVP